MLAGQKRIIELLRIRAGRSLPRQAVPRVSGFKHVAPPLPQLLHKPLPIVAATVEPAGARSYVLYCSLGERYFVPIVKAREVAAEIINRLSDGAQSYVRDDLTTKGGTILRWGARFANGATIRVTHERDLFDILPGGIRVESVAG